MIRAAFLAISAAFALCVAAQAQSPMPVVVPANRVPVQATAVRAAAGPDSSAAMLSQLEQLKAANVEIIRKQAATLEALDELLKNAEQLRVYTKRS